MANTEIMKINSQINVLKEEYTKLQNEINYFYWPKDALIRKRKKDYIWLFGISICILISVILAVFCNILKNEYLIGVVLGLSVLLLGFTGFMGYRYSKKHQAVKEEWNKSLIPVDDLKKSLDKNMEEAMKKMIEFLMENHHMSQDEILREAGTSYDEIYVYYDQMINS